MEQVGVEIGNTQIGTQLRPGRCQGSGLHVASGLEDLTAVGPCAVLTALRAGTVREVLGQAGRVGTRHQRRGDSLPLGTAVAGVAARHLPLRDSHFLLLV
jgi:hypothetical protein